MGITVFGPDLHCVVMTLVGWWLALCVNSASHQPGHYRAVKTGSSHFYSLISICPLIKNQTSLMLKIRTV